MTMSCAMNTAKPEGQAIEAGPGGCGLALLPAAEALGRVEVRQKWSELLAGVNHLNRLHASSDWFEHLLCTDPNANLRLATPAPWGRDDHRPLPDRRAPRPPGLRYRQSGSHPDEPAVGGHPGR